MTIVQRPNREVQRIKEHAERLDSLLSRNAGAVFGHPEDNAVFLDHSLVLIALARALPDGAMLKRSDAYLSEMRCFAAFISQFLLRILDPDVLGATGSVCYEFCELVTEAGGPRDSAPLTRH